MSNCKLQFTRYDLNIPLEKIFFIKNGAIKMHLDNLPKHIKWIVMDSEYLFPLTNLPEHIKGLILDDEYNFELENLPYKLKYLILGKNNNTRFGILPQNLKILQINNPHYSHNIIHIPKTIRKLIIYSNNVRIFDDLNQTCLEELDLANYSTNYYNSNQNDNNNDNNEINNINLNKLPNTLKILSLPNYFNGSIDDLELPNSIVSLSLGKFYNIKINKFPNELKWLDLGNWYNHPIDNLPETLEQLIIGIDFDDTLILPKNLKILDISDNHFINVVSLPDTLEKLYIGKSHRQLSALKEEYKKLIRKGKLEIIEIIDEEYITNMIDNERYFA